MMQEAAAHRIGQARPTVHMPRFHGNGDGTTAGLTAFAVRPYAVSYFAVTASIKVRP